jgi:hypothetical protein
MDVSIDLMLIPGQVIGMSVETEGDIAGATVVVTTIMAMATAGRVGTTLPTGMVGTTVLITETTEITLLPLGTIMKAGVVGGGRFHRIGWQKEATGATELTRTGEEGYGWMGCSSDSPASMIRSSRLL